MRFRDAKISGSTLRHNRNFRWLWLGQAASLLNDEVLETSIILWLGIAAVNGESWGPAAVAGVLAARMAPILLFGLLGGVYCDRWDRRRTMLTMDAIRAVLVAGLAILLLVGDDLPIGTQLGAIYAVLTLCALATVFFNPARFGLLAAIVTDADRERMGSIMAGTVALAAIVGPALAAAMLVVSDVHWSLMITSVGFVISFASVARVRVEKAEQPCADTGQLSAVWQELVTGLRFFAQNELLRVMLMITAMTVAGISTVYTLGVFFVTENLNAPAQLYGVLGTAFGVGSLVGAGLSAVFASRLRASRVYVYGFALAGLLLIGYSRTSSASWALVMLFLTGIPFAAVNSMMGPLLMRSTPSHLLGRVTGVLLLTTRLAGVASVSLAAWLAMSVLDDLDTTVLGVHFGTIDTVFLVAGAAMVTTGLLAARSLRAKAAPASPAPPSPVTGSASPVGDARQVELGGAVAADPPTR